MSHTPEPWKVKLYQEGVYIGFGSDSVIAKMLQDGQKGRDNAERSVACVNACAGLTPLTPEGASVFRECVEALDSLVKVSHLYLTSSEEARQRPLFGQPLNVAFPHAIQEARQALTHAQGTR